MFNAFCPQRPLTPPSEPASPSSSRNSFSDSADFSDFESSSSSAYICHPARSMRQQRQRATRQQCTTAHLDQISALVLRMIDDKEQCTVSTPPATPMATDSPNTTRRNSLVSLPSIEDDVIFSMDAEQDSVALDCDSCDDVDPVDNKQLGRRTTSDGSCGRTAGLRVCSITKEARFRSRKPQRKWSERRS